MATKTTVRAKEDFPRIIGGINRVKSDIQEIVRKIEGIEKLEQEILDDPKRRAEIKKIFDIDPTYTIKGTKAEIKKLNALKEKLI